MTLSDLFDTLLVDRSIVLELEKSHAESLRVQLSKKWSKYKTDMDACGFLSTELAACSMMRRAGDTAGLYEFVLEPNKRSTIQYTVLPAPEPQEPA